ncbi:MAG: tRNA pseudouridine(38-40) synthase TruA, partial [Candidatus Omnitrophica bacterium]|nr:tRNA pseudouridine(38-40) synthase TruA [Candidatus Omnitrophota bacterium]
GTDYCGWQVQNSRRSCASIIPPSAARKPKKSIQEVIEKTLRKILQEDIKLCASGRTDAGVHALGQVANFKTSSKILPDKLKASLNSLLPRDIVVVSIEEVGLSFHSRFDAKSKIYRYTILNRDYPCVSLRNKAYFYPHFLDISLMRREARYFLGRHDFKSFSSSASRAKDTRRTIKNIAIRKSPYPDEKNRIITIEIEANGFLYNMARRIVGTLIEVARGRFHPKISRKILLSAGKEVSGPTAPACGLCLLTVKY